ncbi:MAG: hypothetical protein CVU69_11245 [Deltaproteobacteria bacterium HGW-Deltaproteobacteria-4]|nr:MAG: hypothetical protein CVU69_11245 [Deltaproteobacteria bacterium HGW-Deltaproteobacteria-4]
MRKHFLILSMALFLTPLSAFAQGLELNLGMEMLAKKQSDIEGMHQLSLIYRTESGYYFGQSLYSSAIGSGGGFFAGGVEAGLSGKLGPDIVWDLGQFVGGGGGASQVAGDGLMLRTHAALLVPVGKINLGLGASWIKISGSDISTPAYGLYLFQPLDLRITAGRPDAALPAESGTEIKSFKPIYSIYLPQNRTKRSGGTLDRIHLIGGEFAFASSARSETFIQANGAVAGDAEGYADWFIGKRYFYRQGRLHPYAEIGIGTAGGGDVDTDGGLMSMAGLGARYNFATGIALEAALGARSSLEGGFLALTPHIKASLPLSQLPSGRNKRSVHWQLSTGLALQKPNPGYWKGHKHSSPSPIMFETAIDFFIREHLYLTGQGYTAILGDVGGYQVGLLGIGYQIDFTKNFSLSIEPLIGAGGGAGVDTQGGLLLAYRVDTDFWLNNSAAISFGFGQITTVKGGGMSPDTYHVGVKLPFSSWH